MKGKLEIKYSLVVFPRSTESLLECSIHPALWAGYPISGLLSLFLMSPPCTWWYIEMSDWLWVIIYRKMSHFPRNCGFQASLSPWHEAIRSINLWNTFIAIEAAMVQHWLLGRKSANHLLKLIQVLPSIFNFLDIFKEEASSLDNVNWVSKITYSFRGFLNGTRFW